MSKSCFLRWEKVEDGTERGYLLGYPETTLFLLTPAGEGMVTLKGVGIPDAEERTATPWQPELAKFVAENRLARFAMNLMGAQSLLSGGAELIAAERLRHTALGYAAERDDKYDPGTLGQAGVAYGIAGCAAERGEVHNAQMAEELWPWGEGWNPSKDALDNYVRAGALIAAQIDVILRKRARAVVQGGAQP